MNELYDYFVEKRLIINKNKILEESIKLNLNEDRLIKILSYELIELLLGILKKEDQK